MKRLLIGGAVLALGIAGLGSAQADKPADGSNKVTGGGQFINSQDPISGAGNTIAFNARGTLTDADGQLQYVFRNDGSGAKGTGKGGAPRHGTISCLNVIGLTEDGGTARLAGTWNDDNTKFVVDVTDAGEGKNAADMISFRSTPDGDCDTDGSTAGTSDDAFNSEFPLGRGNVQVHKAK